MKGLQLIFFFLLLALFSCQSDAAKSFAQTPPRHDGFDALLKEYVDEDGMVNYAGLQKDSVKLNAYLQTLESAHPNDNWSEHEQLAYWINAYNAYTLQLIIRNYWIPSIKEITFVSIPWVHSPWDLKFIEIEGERYDLNNIEHGIIREEFDVPEIHFALVCAAVSCPRLRQEAYIADRLQEQLAEQARDFLSDPSKNLITKDYVQLSKIFSWYRGDFQKEGDVVDFINRYRTDKVNADARIDYLPYNWNLNAQLR